MALDAAAEVGAGAVEVLDVEVLQAAAIKSTRHETRDMRFEFERVTATVPGW
jgi:hypothetical protein